MRHLKHRHQLGVKKEHRQAIMASLSAALFRHDRIQTTLGYAKALRPFAEKVITLAKKADDEGYKKAPAKKAAKKKTAKKAAAKKAPAKKDGEAEVPAAEQPAEAAEVAESKE